METLVQMIINKYQRMNNETLHL